MRKMDHRVPVWIAVAIIAYALHSVVLTVWHQQQRIRAVEERVSAEEAELKGNIADAIADAAEAIKARDKEKQFRRP